MPIAARILADSVSPAGIRLTTMEIVCYRYVWAEFMTHRCFSRNAGSTRATPIATFITRVLDDPAIPTRWGSNGKGMQDHGEVAPEVAAKAEKVWLRARDNAIESVRELEELGIHKQISNRLLEPWSLITAIVTATDWGNFFDLRRAPDAQPEIRVLAERMWEAYMSSTPTLLGWDDYHLPLIQEGERAQLGDEQAVKVSVGRCARVSYLTHHGVRDPTADIALHDQLAGNGHWSPFEHVARPQIGPGEYLSQCGNLWGWTQYRKVLPAEHPYDGGDLMKRPGIEAVSVSPAYKRFFTDSKTLIIDGTPDIIRGGRQRLRPERVGLGSSPARWPTDAEILSVKAAMTPPVAPPATTPEVSWWTTIRAIVVLIFALLGALYLGLDVAQFIVSLGA